MRIASLIAASATALSLSRVVEEVTEAEAERLFTADRLAKGVTPDWIGMPRAEKYEWRAKAAPAPREASGQ